MDVLTPGARLGPYEVLAPLGAGGMGHVYRATDTRLDRTIAIKVLSPELSSDLASRGRFEREARSIAALSHHHICTLYDVGDHGGQAFLVMELLEGQTLASRLAGVKGGLPVPEALSIATAVAEALTFAHRHRIVHRDIKPANVMLTPTGVKLVDFGLARWRERDEGIAHTQAQASVTEPHAVMGTLAYMSPEQLDGRADERSDVFAFGALLFEMLTGRKTFAGDSSVKVMAAIVREEPPPVSSLRPVLPVGLDRLVRRCLEKDPDSRWQSMADLANEIRWIAREQALAQPAPVVRLGRWVAWAAIAIAALVIIGLIAGRGFSVASPGPLMRLSFSLPQGTTLPSVNAGVAISPDGETVVYVGATGSGNAERRGLFVKRLDSADVKAVADSEGATYPFFSPDGTSVGFVANRKLKKLTLQSGAVSVISDLGADSSGADASWGTDGSILIGDRVDLPSVGIRRVSTMDGSVTVLTRPNLALGERAHYGAQRLPGVDTFFYTVRSNGQSGVEFRVVAQKSEGAAPQVIIPGASLAKYFGEGQLIYQVGNDLMAASLDPITLAVTNARRLIDQVSPSPGGAAWAIAGDTLVYRGYVPGSRRLTWVDRQGVSTPLWAPTRDYLNPAISPNGEQIALTIRDGNRSDLWLIDLRRQTLTPITTDGISGGGFWTNETDYIGRRSVGAAMEIFTVPVNGSGAPRLLLRGEGMLYPASLAPDRRTMLVMTPGDTTGPDLWTFDLADPKTAVLYPLVRMPASDWGGRVSPDGKWVAYFSNGSGRHELYVTALAGNGPKWRISPDGAREAVWSKDGKELFYRSSSDLHVVAVTAGDSFTWLPARKLLSGSFSQQGGPGDVNYDISADGQRFLMIEEAAPVAPVLNVVRSWPLLLK